MHLLIIICLLTFFLIFLNFYRSFANNIVDWLSNLIWIISDATFIERCLHCLMQWLLILWISFIYFSYLKINNIY